MNPVETYLKEQIISEHNYKKLSVKNISRALKLKRSKVYKHCLESDRIRKVKPLELGSMIYASNYYVFTFDWLEPV